MKRGEAHSARWLGRCVDIAKKCTPAPCSAETTDDRSAVKERGFLCARDGQSTPCIFSGIYYNGGENGAVYR